MTFADPYLLGLVALVPLLLFLKTRLEHSGTGSFSNIELLAGYRPTWRVRFRWLPTAVRVCALVLLVVGLARPRVGQAESEVPGQGVDIALILDTSSSMSASNLGTQTRLAVAQHVLSDFISGRKEDRIGLVIFRSDSLVLSPLTLDYDGLKGSLAKVQDVNLSDGTAIGVGLSDGLNLLRESKARSRIAILLTDGENNSGNIEPLAAARIAQTLGIRVYTIGVIDPKDRGGGVDEKALQEMARVTGGRYYSAQSAESLSNIYASIDQLEKSRVGRPQFLSYNELAPYFLVAALALLALELGLRSTVWRQAT